MKAQLIAKHATGKGDKKKPTPKNEDPSELKREMRSIQRMLYKINSVLQEKKLDE